MPTRRRSRGDEDFLGCRTYNHAWERFSPIDLEAPWYGWRLSLRCIRCASERQRQHQLRHRGRHGGGVISMRRATSPNRAWATSVRPSRSSAKQLFTKLRQELRDNKQRSGRKGREDQYHLDQEGSQEEGSSSEENKRRNKEESLSTNPTVTIERVTPTQAKQWLQGNVDNRKLRETRVVFFTRLLQEDEWELTGDAIVFADQGILINGQHRLTAVVVSKVPAQFLVLRGVPSKTQEVMDQRTQSESVRPVTPTRCALSQCGLGRTQLALPVGVHRAHFSAR